ncbi:MAG: hypothetical protein KJ626_16640 [Verrucomicrobia bacterium]|nr:hypothetical protein [Verrucomicrobiota bacterium]
MKKLAVMIIAATVSVSAFAEHVWLISGSIYHRSAHNVYMGTVASCYMGVWPVAPGHTAGSVYTDDGWQTVKWSSAGWLANVTGPYGNIDENWSLEMSGYHGGGYSPITFEFALYVTDQWGNWYWDNNGGANHQITHYAYYNR